MSHPQQPQSQHAAFAGGQQHYSMQPHAAHSPSHPTQLQPPPQQQPAPRSVISSSSSAAAPSSTQFVSQYFSFLHWLLHKLDPAVSALSDSARSALSAVDARLTSLSRGSDVAAMEALLRDPHTQTLLQPAIQQHRKAFDVYTAQRRAMQQQQAQSQQTQQQSSLSHPPQSHAPSAQPHPLDLAHSPNYSSPSHQQQQGAPTYTRSPSGQQQPQMQAQQRSLSQNAQQQQQQYNHSSSQQQYSPSHQHQQPVGSYPPTSLQRVSSTASAASSVQSIQPLPSQQPPNASRVHSLPRHSSVDLSSPPNASGYGAGAPSLAAAAAAMDLRMGGGPQQSQSQSQPIARSSQPQPVAAFNAAVRPPGSAASASAVPAVPAAAASPPARSRLDDALVHYSRLNSSASHLFGQRMSLLASMIDSPDCCAVQPVPPIEPPMQPIYSIPSAAQPSAAAAAAHSTAQSSGANAQAQRQQHAAQQQQNQAQQRQTQQQQPPLVHMIA